MFSPTGGRIAFESNRAGHSQILIMKADGTEVKVLADGPGELSALRFKPDGGQIFYAQDFHGEVKSIAIDLGQAAGG